jgi:hypothetical protein
MTTTITDTPTVDASRALRLVLRANATSSAACGVIGAAGARFWSDRLGIDNVALTAAVSVGLLAFAAVVWLASNQPSHRLRSRAVEVSVADIAWVLASLVVVAAGVLSVLGASLALVLALIVACFAAGQLWYRRRLAA